MTGNQRRQRTLVNEVRSVQERVEGFEAHNPYLNFRYRDPETNFNRRSVKGVVARVIKLKDRSTSMALETAAGGRVKIKNIYVKSKLYMFTLGYFCYSFTMSLWTMIKRARSYCSEETSKIEQHLYLSTRFRPAKSAPTSSNLHRTW